jgi:RHS repeat-associated protein
VRADHESHYRHRDWTNRAIQPIDVQSPDLSHDLDRILGAGHTLWRSDRIDRIELEPLLFDGQYLDSESGYLYLRNRLYDPTTSQFVSRDPLSGITGIPYAFADNDPGDKRDDSGLCSLSSLTRAPDYYTASASWPSQLGFIGPGGSVTISRDGGVYWGFDGMVGLPGPSGSLRGGWIDQCAVPTPCQLDSFISGGSLTFSGYVPLGEAANGPAAAATWGHEGQYTLNSTSREVGWGAGPLPAGGLSQSYSQAWFNSGISW